MTEEICDKTEESKDFIEKNKNEISNGKVSLFNQVLLATACSFVHISIGCIMGFSGVTLPQLIAKETPVAVYFLNDTNNHLSDPNKIRNYFEDYFDNYTNIEIIMNTLNTNHLAISNASNICDTRKFVNKTQDEIRNFLIEELTDFYKFNGAPPWCLVNTFGNDNYANTTLEESISTYKEYNNSNSYDLILNKDEATLFSSGGILGALIGCAFSGLFMTGFGQRTTLLIFLPYSVILWIIIAASPNSQTLIAARILSGFGMGLMSSSSQLYVIEVAHNMYRGYLVGAVDFSRNSGILIMFCIGASQLWWRYQALIAAFTTLIPPFIIILFLKPSPRWLAVKGRKTQAEEALKFYRGPKYDVEHEIQQIFSAASSSSSKSMGITEQIKFLCTPKIARLFGLLFIVTISSHTTGNFALISFATNIIIESVPSVNPFIAAVILGIFRSFGGIILIATSGKCGRRIIFLISMIVCSISMAIMGTYIYFNPSSYWWLPLICLMVFFCSITIAAPVGGLFVQELIPLKCRLLGSSIINLEFFTAGFTIAQTFTYLNSAINLYGTFWLYASVSFLLSFFPLLVLPETKNKNLEEIQLELKIR